MVRSGELEFEFEDEMEHELEYERSGMVRGAPRIQIVYSRALPGSREFEYEDEGELFDPAPPPRGAALLTRFAVASAAFTRDHRVILPRLAAALFRVWPKKPTFCLYVSVVGHEDEVGDPARFGEWGRKRAKAVAEELKKQMNALWARLPAASRPNGQVIFEVSTAGPRKPIRSNVTRQGQALNRRVEVTARRPDVCRDIA